jgi:PAS domain S-box-containing protein
VVPSNGPQKPLSAREQQLIEFASNGFTDVAIATKLGISEATVATYWVRIRMKYGPLPRPELVAHAVREQYLNEVEDLKEENQVLMKSLMQGKSKGSKAEADFFRDALEAAGDAILLVDEGGTIEWANSAATEVFGFSKSEMEGQYLSMLVPERFRKSHKVRMREYVKEPSKRRMSEHSTTFALTKGGEERPVAATLAPMSTAGGTYVVCVVRPLSAVAAKLVGADL